MNNFITEWATGGKIPQLPSVDISQLPAKLSKRLWVEPSELVRILHAPQLAEWALATSQWQPRLPEAVRRGRKVVYRDSSILVMALIQVAWQMSYEEIVDYLRSHPATAQAIGFGDGRVIGVSQYWERRRSLGIFPFWLFFVALAWQLIRQGVILGQARQRLNLGLQGAYAALSSLPIAPHVPGDSSQSSGKPAGDSFAHAGCRFLWLDFYPRAGRCWLFHLSDSQLYSYRLGRWLYD